MNTKSDRKIFLSDIAVGKLSNFGIIIFGSFVFWQMFFVPLLFVLAKYFPQIDPYLGFMILAETIVFFTVIFFLRYQILTLRNPYAFVAMVHVINFRLFFAQSIFWLLLASVHWLWLALVILAWCASEFAHHYEKSSVNNDEVARSYAQNFSKNFDGYIMYTPDENRKTKSLSVRKNAFIKILDTGGMLVMSLMVLIGPFLFIRSQLYREDFEPRFVIAGAIMLVLAFGFRRFYTRSSFSRRALLLKQAEKF